MPWYKAGTVSVAQNSNAVTGSNTSFIANSRVGDAFLGPDGRWYEVTNIASDTAMAISPNYLGATTSAGTYALAPMQGYVKDSADALRALVNQFGEKLAALRTTGNYDILPVLKGGTGSANAAGAIANLGLANGSQRLRLADAGVASPNTGLAAQGLYFGWNEAGLGEGDFVVNKGAGSGGYRFRSVNSDNSVSGPAMTLSYQGELVVPLSLQVPQITGMTTPLSAAQGGTGANSPAGALNALGAMPIAGSPSAEPGFASAKVSQNRSAINSQGMYLLWNTGAGGLSGDGAFVCNQGGGSGGFSWRSINTANSLSGPVMTYSYNGSLAIPAGATPAADGGANLGNSSLRWSTIFAIAGTINTSDAREKTDVVPMSQSQISAAILLGREIGTYKWLTSVSEKGDSARTHVGMTVQRAIEIMESQGLDPMSHAFICYDEWAEVPEVSVEVAMGNIYSLGELVAKDAPYSDFEAYGGSASFTWEETSRETMITQQFKAGGNRYGFRYDQLALFIARGQEERIARLEALMMPAA